MRFRDFEQAFDVYYVRKYLVGGLEHFSFSHILGIIIQIDFHIFQRGFPQPPTRYPDLSQENLKKHISGPEKGPNFFCIYSSDKS